MQVLNKLKNAAVFLIIVKNIHWSLMNKDLVVQSLVSIVVYCILYNIDNGFNHLQSKLKRKKISKVGSKKII